MGSIASPQERVASIQAAFPAEGLFQDKEWLISPDAFPLNAETVAELQRLGEASHAFNLACNRLYRESAEGTQPGWVAKLLDRGKPPRLVEYNRGLRFAGEYPAVLRPDVILGEGGLYVTELDSLPGGIGVTAWMNQTFARFDDAVIGGESGMIEGFARLMEGGDILISRESQGYKPEMLWITAQMRRLHPELGDFRVIDSWDFQLQDRRSRSYRYFELWDLPNVEHAEEFMRLAEEGAIRFTPPFKTLYEEKLWLVLFWSLPLEGYWREALGKDHFEFLRGRIPYGWVVDPTPIPPFGEIPRLKIHSWEELGAASQKERQLALKISGFSEQAWGSHGVYIGHDLPSREWKEALAQACQDFETHPYVLQEFHKGRLVRHSYFEPATGAIREMQGRVRLCPYFFVEEGRPRLVGVMATICPADKKLIHGMKDAIIVPCTVAG